MFLFILYFPWHQPSLCSRVTFKHQLLRMQMMLGSLYKVQRAAVESTHTHTHTAKIMLAATIKSIRGQGLNH